MHNTGESFLSKDTPILSLESHKKKPYSKVVATKKESQTLIVVDDNDIIIQYASRSICHRGNGLRHRGVAILLHNSKAEILLQKRRNELFDNMWDLAGATHPLHLDHRNETYEESGIRCLKTEWGMTLPLQRVLAFTYFERYNNRCENEYCVLLRGEYDGELNPNPLHIYEFRWVTGKQLVNELDREPKGFTPWLRKSVEGLNGSLF